MNMISAICEPVIPIEKSRPMADMEFREVQVFFLSEYLH